MVKKDRCACVEEQIQETMERRQSLQPKETSGGDAQVAETGKPSWHMQQFRSWEPQTFESPYGKRTVVGPVGYHMYWGYSDPHEGKQEGEQEGENKMETSDAATTAQDGQEAKEE